MPPPPQQHPSFDSSDLLPPGARSLHNAASPELLASWLADPSEIRIQSHLSNLATLYLRRGEGVGGAGQQRRRLPEVGTWGPTDQQQAAAAAGSQASFQRASSAVGAVLATADDMELPHGRTSLSAIQGTTSRRDGSRGDANEDGYLLASAASKAAVLGSPKNARSPPPVSRPRWANGDWCYSRLSQTWGSAALTRLGFTKRRVVRMMMTLQEELGAEGGGKGSSPRVEGCQPLGRGVVGVKE